MKMWLATELARTFYSWEAWIMARSTTGGLFVRVDCLGRAVIPKQVRRRLGIHEGSLLLMTADGDQIIFQKYYPEGDLQPCVDTMQSLLDEAFYAKQLDADKLNELQMLLDAIVGVLRRKDQENSSNDEAEDE